MLRRSGAGCPGDLRLAEGLEEGFAVNAFAVSNRFIRGFAIDPRPSSQRLPLWCRDRHRTYYLQELAAAVHPLLGSPQVREIMRYEGTSSLREFIDESRYFRATIRSA